MQVQSRVQNSHQPLLLGAQSGSVPLGHRAGLAQLQTAVDRHLRQEQGPEAARVLEHPHQRGLDVGQLLRHRRHRQSRVVARPQPLVLDRGRRRGGLPLGMQRAHQHHQCRPVRGILGQLAVPRARPAARVRTQPRAALVGAVVRTHCAQRRRTDKKLGRPRLQLPQLDRGGRHRQPLEQVPRLHLAALQQRLVAAGNHQLEAHLQETRLHPQSALPNQSTSARILRNQGQHQSRQHRH
mmetsp:Transcript_81112/g.175321  ORF Transcript_81112/g.175321 Transcript_81112/m.175321 type:complete len:239 (+) Transcript_81112:400-1116(+)